MNDASEMRAMLGDTVNKLFGDMLDRNCREAAEAGIIPQQLWHERPRRRYTSCRSVIL